MERKLDLRPCVIWVGGDAFVQIVDVKMKGGTSNLSLEVKVLNKSGSILDSVDCEVYFYDSSDAKLQEDAYLVSGNSLSILPNDIGIALECDVSKSFPNARRAEIKLLKAVFDDNKSIDLVYEDMEKFAMPSIKEEDLSLLRNVAGLDALCMPAKLALNWRCVCGYFNGDESEICSNCMRDKTQIFSDYGSIEKLREFIEKEILGDTKEEVVEEVVVDEEIKEEVNQLEDELQEKVSFLKEALFFLSSIPKMILILSFLSGIMMSTSLFILMFRK